MTFQDQGGGGGRPGQAQRAATDFIVFGEIQGINTRAARIGLDPRQAAWMENLQPIAPNKLQVVPHSLPPIITESTPLLRAFFASINGIDWIILFQVDGSARAINLATNLPTIIAPAGTFALPDLTQWRNERVLIADPAAGYGTWDGSLFVNSGISPNIVVTNGGSGYLTPPLVTITGTGLGATATATVTAGSVTKVTLTNPGTNWLPGSTPAISFTAIGGGSGAAATAVVWNQHPIPTLTTLAVFANRVWFAGARVLAWTGTSGFDDFNPANAAGFLTISDADLIHEITALRSLNNFLYIFGDQSIKQIGSISVQAGSTIFTIVTLSSDQGTTFMLTIQSYNRIVVFMNTVGVFGIFGASVQKLSDDLDGVLDKINFSQAPVACVGDIHNIHCYLLLLLYEDPRPGHGTHPVIFVLQGQKWFPLTQAAGTYILSVLPEPTSKIFGSPDGQAIAQYLGDPNTAVSWVFQTALTANGNPVQGKKAIRTGIMASVGDANTFVLEMESELGFDIFYTYQAFNTMTWANNSGGVFTWVNNVNGAFSWLAFGPAPMYLSVDDAGIYLGCTLSGSSVGLQIHTVAIEYQESGLWGTARGALV